MSKRHVVHVTIMGEEYAIRSDAAPERTRAVAEFVDKAIRRVNTSGTVIESHKAAILAALQIAGELFEARDAQAQVAELTDEMKALGTELERLLPPVKRVSGASDGATT